MLVRVEFTLEELRDLLGILVYDELTRQSLTQMKYDILTEKLSRQHYLINYSYLLTSKPKPEIIEVKNDSNP